MNLKPLLGGKHDNNCALKHSQIPPSLSLRNNIHRRKGWYHNWFYIEQGQNGLQSQYDSMNSE